MLFLYVKSFADENNVYASVIFSTSIDLDLPYIIFEGKTWSTAPSTRYARLDILFDEPIEISVVNIEFKNKMKNYVMIYLNDLDNTYYQKPSDNKISLDLQISKTVNSVKFNFGKNDIIKVKNITIYDKNKKPYNIKTPRIVNGNVKVTSTLSPERFYNIYKIFDSKLEDGWSSDKRRTGDIIEFSFEKPQIIKGFKIWNGYQRSEVHYNSNSRIKTLKIEGDNNYNEIVTLVDKIGEQMVSLPKPFNGTNLKMTVIDSYPGTVYKDLVISELRFFDGDRYFFINPIKFLKENIEYNKKEFAKANLSYILDEEIGSYSGSEEYGEGSSFSFRFKSDGSIYLQGEEWKENNSKRFFAIGNYEIIKADKDGMEFRLFGYIVNQEGEGEWFDGDCGGGGYSYVYKDAEKKIFTEFIHIRTSSKDNSPIVINKSKKNLLFEKIKCYIRN